MMGWKNWSYTKKGLLMGIFIWILLELSAILIYKISGLFGAIISAIAVFPCMLLFGDALSQTRIIILYLIGLIFYGAVGALIGFIVGKIKSRNN